MMPSLETLQRFPVFAQLDRTELKTLAMLADEMAVSQGESLFQEGDTATALYLILQGCIDIVFKMGQRDNHPTSLETLGVGEMVGWSALVAPYVYTSSAVASTDARLLRVDSIRLRQLMEEDTGVGYGLMSYAAQVIRRRLTNMYLRFASLVEA